MLKNSKKESKKGDKLKPRYLGPYTVEDTLGKGVYIISNPTTGRKLMTGVNKCRLKIYYQPKHKVSS
jgi:hypothetical protein